MSRRTLVMILAGAATACTSEVTPREPTSVVVVDDSVGRLVNGIVPSPDGSRIAYTQVVNSGRSSVFVSAPDGSNPIQVSHGVWDTDPVWSPDGKWIAFQSEDPEFDVYVVPSDGSARERQITSGPEDDTPAAWLSDGSGVIFIRTGGGDDRPMVVPLDGGTPRRIGPVMQGNLHGVYSPNGAHFGFDLHRGGVNTVWVLDSATGSAPRQLTTEGLESVQSNHFWSPDGKEIAYVSRRTGTADIHVLDVASGASRQLTTDVRDDIQPRWSPDGRWIAFISDRGGQRDLWLISSAGGNASRLTNDAAIESQPMWAADGKSVSYQRTTSPVDLQLVPLAGGPVRTLYHWDEYDIASARISPDGKTVVFENPTVGNGDVFTIPVEGGEPVSFGSSSRRDGSPRYSPDGSQVAILSDRAGTMDLWLVPTAGGEARNLTQSPGDEGEAIWSPDGQQIAFASSRDAGGGTDLWVMPIAGGAPKRLTTGVLRPAFVQWSPDGKQIYFVGEKPGGGGARDYFRISAAGGRIEALGANPTIGVARLSRDGTRVAYSSFERGWAFTDVMPVRGGPSTRLSRDTSDVYHAGSAWTLDDSLLVVASLDLPGNRDAADLWTYRISNGEWTQITRTPGFDDPYGFTPDRKDVLVVLRSNRSQLRRVSVADLVTVRE